MPNDNELKPLFIRKLKPCPFCSSSVEWEPEPHYIICYECGFTYGTDQTRVEIFKFWNTRSKEASDGRKA